MGFNNELIRVRRKVISGIIVIPKNGNTRLISLFFDILFGAFPRSLKGSPVKNESRFDVDWFLFSFEGLPFRSIVSIYSIEWYSNGMTEV